jgi:hypothetical protein
VRALPESNLESRDSIVFSCVEDREIISLNGVTLLLLLLSDNEENL